jgi:O-acetyl-ADP-ribose deacetylase (regulator of RNase III)
MSGSAQGNLVASRKIFFSLLSKSRPRPRHVEKIVEMLRRLIKCSGFCEISPAMRAEKVTIMTSGLGNGGTVSGLALDQYRYVISLDEPYQKEPGCMLSESERATIVARLLDRLIHGEGLTGIEKLPATYERQRSLLRGVLNIRPPEPLDSDFISDMDRLLQDETNRSGIADGDKLLFVSDTVPVRSQEQLDRLVLWKGDIARLHVDAIVNAANDQLLGCFQPLHNCIDNVIHSAAGPMLRQDCRSIMDIQQHREQTGDAKITRAYNLPSRYVLHTVGPIIGIEGVGDFQRHQLASCYCSCLALADCLPNIKTIAFPCISTGVFNFPREMATVTAIRAVTEWLRNNRHHFERVIFNVYLQEDFDGYVRAFQR